MNNKQMLSVSVFNTPVGNIEIEHDEHLVYKAVFSEKQPKFQLSEFTLFLADELSEYFKNPNHCFKIPLKAQGSSFQESVWDALQSIPRGSALTYGDLAKMLQSSPRAIGQACKRNPIVLFIPCHRVVGKGNLGGYMGKNNAIDYKIQLLKHEFYL